MPIRVSGYVLTVFIAELDMTEEAFDALTTSAQQAACAQAIGGLQGIGAETCLVVDDVEELS